MHRYVNVPKLPSKKYFFNFDDEFIKKRKQELERYLKEVLQVSVCSNGTHSSKRTNSRKQELESHLKEVLPVSN